MDRPYLYPSAVEMRAAGVECIWPECPYCPACPYGYESYPEWVEIAEDLEWCRIEWVCTLKGGAADA